MRLKKQCAVFKSISKAQFLKRGTVDGQQRVITIVFICKTVKTGDIPAPEEGPTEIATTSRID